MKDPLVQRKIRELSPSPLEEVHVFSFRLADHFWKKTIGATSEQLCHVREHGTFLGSVKIEVWRSHAAITLHELPPQGQSKGWQTRRVDIYRADPAGSHVLWELYVESAANCPRDRTRSVELRYEAHAMVLAVRTASQEGEREEIVFRVPLAAEQLRAFRSEDEQAYCGERSSNAEAGPYGVLQKAETQRYSFAHEDAQQGFDWQLCIRELHGVPGSEHWLTLDPWQTQRVS